MLKIEYIRKLRIISQSFFLILFLFFLTQSEYRASFSLLDTEIRSLPYPLTFFFNIDPLIAISTAISTHSLYKGLIWSLFIIVLTLIVGRFFCGWICPLGTLNHIISVIKPFIPPKKRIERNKTQNWQKIKFYILIGTLFLALFTSLQVGILDPISFLFRSLSISIFPAINLTFLKIVEKIYDTHIPILPDALNIIHKTLSKYILPYSQTYFHHAWIIGLLFFTVLILNRYIVRFWCRGICPLGALLGLLSKFAIFGISKKHENCDNCNRCLLVCQGASSPQGGVKWQAPECHLCLNCQAVCPKDVIHFTFFPNVKESADFSPNLTRRNIIFSAFLGLSLFPLLRSSDKISKNQSSKLIRPPGALEEEEFLKRCIKCGECMKVCPTNALHPALFQGGIEALWTPILIPRIGYCEHSCVLCTQVCPTGAIRKLTKEEKTGVYCEKHCNPCKPNCKIRRQIVEERKLDDYNSPVRLGLAFIDRGRCLPWGMSIPCIVCEEHCPASPKAIWVEEVKVLNGKGEEVVLKRPYVDPNLCVGCGICENKCPIYGEPAIYVTCAGETRSKKSQILL